jgi:hypothetical protein
LYTALRATSQTLTGFLLDRLRSDAVLGALFDPAAGGVMDATLNSPQQMSQASMQGLSVWLYRVLRDEERLNAPPVRVGPDLVRRPPLPLRLHYLLTPVTATDAADGTATEQVILGKVLQIFHDTCRLRGVSLRDDFSGTEIDLHLRLESLTVDELTRVWDALEAPYRLSVSYEVSVVEIDISTEPDRFARVLSIQPEYALIVTPEPA